MRSRIAKSCCTFAAGFLAVVAPGALAVGATSVDIRLNEQDVTILGAATGDRMPKNFGIASADVNGDGVDDLILGATGVDDSNNNQGLPGELHILFGRSYWPATLDLAAQAEDVRITGDQVGDLLGLVVAAGDINGDGIADVIAGAPRRNTASAGFIAGTAYVFFGRSSWPSVIDLNTDSADVTILAADRLDRLGWSAETGDLNDDGVEDLVLGARWSRGFGNSRNTGGEGYIFFGRATWPAVIDLTTTSADVAIYGADPFDQFSLDLGIGDLNGDGIVDLAAGANGRGPANDRSSAGEIHIFLGRTSWSPVLDVQAGDADITVYGEDSNDLLAWGIEVEDVNGDGIGDLLTGAHGASGPGNSRHRAGEGYIIFGTASWAGEVDLAVTPPDVRVLGDRIQEQLGLEVKAADLNGDGLNDLVLVAWAGTGPVGNRFNAGQALVFFGRQSWPAVIDTRSEAADVSVWGAQTFDTLSSAATGDINGDGIADLLLGADRADGPGEARADAGEAYLVLGQADNEPPVAVCSDVTVEASDGCVADAAIDNGSFDPDGGSITLMQEPEGPYGLGQTTVTLTVSDDLGASDSCEAVVTVIDTTPPAIDSLFVDPSELWPPNHKMRQVVVEVSASDTCGPNPSCAVVSVSSDEPVNAPGDGETEPDWLVLGSTLVSLRSERAGDGNGRTYTLEVACLDDAGNQQSSEATVEVPHDRGD